MLPYIPYMNPMGKSASIIYEWAICTIATLSNQRIFERIMYSENSDSTIQPVTGWFGEGLEMIDDIGHRSLDQ